MGHNWSLNRTGVGRTKVCKICGINGDDPEDASEPCSMTPEPRDLTERREEEIHFLLWPNYLNDYDRARELTKRIIAADPATALLERAVEVLSMEKALPALSDADRKQVQVHYWDKRDTLLTELLARAGS